MEKSTQEETLLHNSQLVLRTIYERGEISRVDVSRLTGLTRTTVSTIAGKFIEDGLVIETGTAPSRGGKPAILLCVAGDARSLIGIDLADSEFRGAVVNLRGQVHQRFCLPVQGCDGEAALQLVYRLVEQLLQQARRPVLGIGIGAPGLMNPSKGIVQQAVNLDWNDLPLVDLLKQRFQMPIYLANDSQAAALGEFIFGNSSRCDNLILVKAGQGVGAGIILEGKLFLGDNAGAGEIGHIQVRKHGKLCRCGNHGCLETVASGPAILKNAQAMARRHPTSLLNQLASTPEALDFEHILQAQAASDPAVRELIQETGRSLAVAVTHLTGALNVNRIIIAGSLARFGDDLIQPIREYVRQGILPALAGQTEIAISSLGDDIVILGAASLLLSNELGLARPINP